MKKIVSLLLVFTLLLPLLTSTVQASDTTTVKPISITTVLDSEKAERTVTITYPATVANVIKGTSVLSGAGTIKKGTTEIINEKERTITYVIEGQKKTSAAKTVKGYASAKGIWFTGNPSNAVCRFSDGKDWQLNSLDTSTLKQTSSRVTNSGSAPTDVPYDIIRDLATTTSPSLNVNATYWFDGETSIPSSRINASTMRIPKDVNSAKSNMGSIFYHKGYDEKNPILGVIYNFRDKIPGTSDYKATRYNVNKDQLSVNPSTNPAFTTGHAGCWWYSAALEYNITAETLPGVAYDYNGTISFQYAGFSEATLVGTLTADPSSTRFEDKDVKIKLTIEGEVFELQDPGALDYYKVYVTLPDGEVIGTDKFEANKQIKIKKTYEYTISKDKLKNKTDYTENFQGRVLAYYKPSSYFKDSVNGNYMDSGLKKTSSYVYKQAAPPPVLTERPVAVIQSDAEVMLGDNVGVSGYDSFDPDGYIVDYAWTTFDAKQSIPGNVADGVTWYDTLGNHMIKLCVTDNDNLQGCAIHSLVVTEPIVKAAISQTGTLKENRKVTLSSTGSVTSARYPIIEGKTTWTIASVTGSIPTSMIKVDGSLQGKNTIDVLFKQPGEYQVTVAVENTAGYKDTATRIYTITPDEIPVADFTFQQKEYRDPKDGNQATFKLTDLSYSTDGDTIVSRKWYVVYDANNDGIFNEPKVLFNSGNNTYVEYKTTKVGKYAFYLEVQEEFGQPTIAKFVTADDRRKGNTWD